MSTDRVQLNGRVLIGNTMATTMEIVKDHETLVGDLRRGMANGVVPFIFRKKDGTDRFAVGTTNPDYFPQKTSGQFGVLMERLEEHIKRADRMTQEAGTFFQSDVDAAHIAYEDMKQARLDLIKEKLEGPKTTKSLDVVTYYDLTSRAWRSFAKEQLVCVFTA